MCVPLLRLLALSAATVVTLGMSIARASAGEETGLACPGLEAGPTRSVARVLDGETVALDDGTELRLIGALAPRAIDAAAESGHVAGGDRCGGGIASTAAWQDGRAGLRRRAQRSLWPAAGPRLRPRARPQALGAGPPARAGTGACLHRRRQPRLRGRAARGRAGGRARPAAGCGRRPHTRRDRRTRLPGSRAPGARFSWSRATLPAWRRYAG